MSNIIELKPKAPAPTYKVVMLNLSGEGTVDVDITGFLRMNGPYMCFMEKDEEKSQLSDTVDMLDTKYIVRATRVTKH